MEGCGGEWFGVPVPRFFLCVGAVHPNCRHYTPSVRVHRHVTGAAPPCLWRLSGLWGSSGLELSSAWTVFRVGSLRRLMLWFLRNVARNSPARISNVEITSLEFCGFLDTYEKLGYPNYVRVLVDEAPKANSCVRSSSHDTVHNPPDASNTTPTPHNAKSRLISAAVGVPPCGRDSHSRAPDRLSPAAPAPREAARETGRGGA